MNALPKHLRPLGICLLALGASLAGAAAPATAPATAPGELIVLGGGAVEFPSPAGWKLGAKSADGMKALFLTPDHKSSMAVEMLPADAQVNPRSGLAIVKALRDGFAKKKVQVLTGPKVEDDPRFVLKIHEQYKAGDKTADQIHLYRSVGGKFITVTVNSVEDDPPLVKQAHEQGEVAALSVTPGPKPPPPRR